MTKHVRHAKVLEGADLSGAFGSPQSQRVPHFQAHVGEKYVLGALAPKNNPDWIGPWDCAEFASWLVFQIAAKLYGCRRDFGDPATADAYTGYWARDAKSLGQIVSLESASRTAGAFVLRIPQAGAVGHIVLSDGAGGTVEAHSSNDGVITSTLAKRRWDTGVLIAGIQYTQGRRRAYLSTGDHRLSADDAGHDWECDI